MKNLITYNIFINENWDSTELNIEYTYNDDPFKSELVQMTIKFLNDNFSNIINVNNINNWSRTIEIRPSIRNIQKIKIGENDDNTKYIIFITDNDIYSSENTITTEEYEILVKLFNEIQLKLLKNKQKETREETKNMLDPLRYVASKYNL